MHELAAAIVGDIVIMPALHKTITLANESLR